MENDLLRNLDRVHTTELGLVRIKRNLGLDTYDVVAWCRQKIVDADSMTRRGKNWYVHAGGIKITVNANSFTIITAHKENA